ncbi:hypothetical protein PIB30_076421 [Stylosanthes scabra]|uniref:Uncharacterized protein n=1 Tax=Stylosanthes scabra TaxID=79078 RepID=A0ABU6XP85_9FABA|nr:hypothetical protein [Stylosanthes scabra]
MHLVVCRRRSGTAPSRTLRGLCILPIIEITIKVLKASVVFDGVFRIGAKKCLDICKVVFFRRDLFSSSCYFLLDIDILRHLLWVDGGFINPRSRQVYRIVSSNTTVKWVSIPRGLKD